MEKDLRFTRNIGIAAHIDAGKTTMTERILFYSGTTHRIGEVHEGNTVMDWMEQERERGITITAACIKCIWPVGDKTFDLNIIDTPGHVDFTVEVNRSLRVVDGLVFLFSAVEGVEPQSETNWRLADNYRVPRLAFINKMDRVGADFFAVVRDIRTKLGANAIPVQLPIGTEENFTGIIDLVTMEARFWNDADQGATFTTAPVPADLKDMSEEYRRRLLEEIALYDENFLEDLMKTPDTLSPDAIRQVLRKAVCAGELTPVLCGSAYKNKGIQACLDAICQYLPAPTDVEATEGIHPKTGEVVRRQPTATDPFCALVFKITVDPYIGKLCFLRVYSGHLESGAVVLNTRTGKRERITRLFQMHANRQQVIQQVSAGDIAAAAGLNEIRTGDTLCLPEYPIVLESMVFPEPVLGLAIEPKTQHDLDNLTDALAKLEEEDPTFQVRYNADTNQLIVHGMGELHLEILLDRLNREFQVAVNKGIPQVNYKEVLTKTVRHREHLAVELPNNALFAEMEFEIGPADPNFLNSEIFKSGKSRLQFEWQVPDKVIDPRYKNPVRDAFASMMQGGVLAGYSLESMKVRVLDGLMHPTESRSPAFERCAKQGFRAAAPTCHPVLLEPIMKIEVVVPSGFLGAVLGDLSRRRGLVHGQTSRSGDVVAVQAEAPLSEMFGYVTALRTLTSGRASATMEFSHYTPVPEHIAKTVLEKG